MSSLSQAHEPEQFEIAAGVQPPEIDESSTKLRNATSRAEAKEIMEAIAAKKNLKKSSKGRYEDDKDPDVILYIETMNRLRKQEGADVTKAKETRHEVKEAVKPRKQEGKNKRSSEHANDLIKIQIEALHEFGILEGEKGDISQTDAIQAADQIKDPEKREKAHERIFALVTERNESLDRYIQKNILKISKSDYYYNLINDMKQFAEDDRLVFEIKGQFNRFEPTKFASPSHFRKLKKLIEVYDQKRKELGEQLKKFDAIKKDPKAAGFTSFILDGEKYFIKFTISPDNKLVRIHEVVSKRSKEQSEKGIQIDTPLRFGDIPDFLKGKVFTSEKGKIVANKLKVPAKPAETKANEPEAKPAEAVRSEVSNEDQSETEIAQGKAA